MASEGTSATSGGNGDREITASPPVPSPEVSPDADVDALYDQIGRDENFLDHGSRSPFPRTVLHAATSVGNTKWAMEIATLRPLFTRKLNKEGYSPMHVALQNEHYGLVRALMTLDPELIRVRGKRGITPLHFVAQKITNNPQKDKELLLLLAEFLYACKSSIEDLTNQCETAVHLAVRSGNMEAFKILFGWLRRCHLTQILNWKDENGETAYNIAESKNNKEITDSLEEYVGVKAGWCDTILEKCCRLTLGTPDFSSGSNSIPSLSDFLKRELTAFEKYANFVFHGESARNVILIVSTLIAAATYQAALTFPEESRKNNWHFFSYVCGNSVAFFASIATIWATTFTEEANPWFHIPIPLLCTSFFLTFIFQIPKTNKALQIFLGSLFGLFGGAVLITPLYMNLKHRTVRRGIDAMRGRAATF